MAQLNQAPVAPTPDALPLNVDTYIRRGYLTLLIGLGGFLLWAALAPLDKGVAANGTVIVTGHRKTVQAPISGIVEKISVQEDATVAEGQALIYLNGVQSQAQLAALREQALTLLATENRLLAEQADQETLTFAPTLTAAPLDAQRQRIMQLQQQLFRSRRQAYQSELERLRYALRGATTESRNLRHTLAQQQTLLASLREQRDNVKPLADEGYLPRNRYLEIDRQYTTAQVELSRSQGRLDQAEQEQQTLRQQIALHQAQYHQEVNSQLTQIRQQRTETASKLKIAHYDQQNTVVAAPIAGKVIGLKVLNKGSFLQAGEPLLEIVPVDQTLVVDARLSVNLRDKVQPGLPVELLFSAFNQATTPRITGLVSLISADRLTDPQTGEAYYALQVTVTPEDLRQLGRHQIQPGMPVELFIKTGERSLLSYLFRPLLDRAHFSLTEE